MLFLTPVTMFPDSNEKIGINLYRPVHKSTSKTIAIINVTITASIVPDIPFINNFLFHKGFN